MTTNTYPRLHNAMWPGLVGKGDGSEPFISLDDMLRLTAAAEVDGVKFDGVDLFLTSPHIDIDSNEDDIKKLAEKIAGLGLKVGSVVAPVWPPTGGGSAMGSEAERKQFVTQIRKSCDITKHLNKTAATLLTVSDIIPTHEKITADQREKSLLPMMKLALETVKML